MKGFKRYLGFILRKRPLAALGACLIGVSSGLFAAGLYGVSSFIISLAALHPTYDLIVVPAVLVRFLGLGRAVLAYLDRYVSHNETFKVLADIRVFVYDSLEPLIPYDAARLDRGYNLSVAVSDVEILQDGLLRIIYPIAVALFAVLFGTAGAYIINPLLAPAFFILAFPLAFVLFGVTAYLSYGRQKKYDEVRQRLYGELLELSGGLTDIKTNSCEAQRKERLSQVLSGGGEAQRTVNRAAALSDAAAGLYSGLSLTALLASAAALCASGRLGGTILAASVVGLSYMTETISGLSTVGARFERVKNAASRIFIRETEDDSNLNSGLQGFDAAGFRKLSVASVSFSYPGRRLLENISFTLAPGAPTVLTGKSGRGKSTVAELLLGFLQPDSGEITADGVPLSTLPEEDRLKLFSVAEQTPHFFNDTIRANLLTDGLDVTKDETLLRVLAEVGLGPFVDALPDGLDTLIFENGDNMSGGELQRLAIARALLKDAPFYIFDEPTAGLDQSNEKNIMTLIMKLSLNKGVLLITHRMSAEIQTDREIHID